mgnify:CR=1 FL=1
MSSADNIATMTLDIKRNRFRIHKSTLKKLGNPQYIQFLINPEEMFIAILGSDRPLAGGTANKVNLIQLPNQSVEFYSNTLLEGVINMIGLIDFRYSYRLSGEVDAANRVAYFSMKTLKKNERRTAPHG